MAKILFGPLTAEIRGSIGGTVFSKSAQCNYIRNKTYGVNPRTSKQSIQKSSFGWLAQYWRSIGTPERNGWTSLALEYPLINSLGKTYYLSGFGMFKKLNQIYWNSCNLWNDIPPNIVLNNFAPLPSVVISMVWDVHDQNFSFSCGITLPSNIMVELQASSPLSQGQTFCNTFKHIFTWPGGSTFPQIFTATYLNIYGGGIRPGNLVVCRYRQIENTSGFFSSWSKVNVIVTT
jgi:hypothetical protein